MKKRLLLFFVTKRRLICGRKVHAYRSMKGIPKHRVSVRICRIWLIPQ